MNSMSLDAVRGLWLLYCVGKGCLLASCSQDCFIRLWKFSRSEDTLPTDPDELTLTEKKFQCFDGQGTCGEYSISLESVLIGKL